jgi:two-component system nitrate/nitrite response regulator NarL
MSTEPPARTDRDSRARCRVLVADDHPVFLDAVARIIESAPELELVGRSSDGRSAMEEIRRLEPDIAVVDINMPLMDGLELLRTIEREQLGTLGLILTGSGEDEHIYRAIAEGARGVVSKTDPSASVIEAILTVGRGETFVSPTFHAALAGQVRLHARSDALVLSEREVEVIRLTAAGCSAAEIGDALHLAVPTIRTHLANIYEKLGVSSAPAAVAEALRRGLFK